MPEPDRPLTMIRRMFSARSVRRDYGTGPRCCWRHAGDRGPPCDRACWQSGAAVQGGRRWRLLAQAGRTADPPARHRWRHSRWGIQVQQGADRSGAAFEATMGMAMPLPKPVDPSFHGQPVFRIRLPSPVRALPWRSGWRFLEHALLLPPGTFTRNGRGSGWFQVGSWMRGISGRLHLAAGFAVFPYVFQLAVELVSQGVDRCIHVLVFGIGDHFTAGNLECGLHLLLQFSTFMITVTLVILSKCPSTRASFSGHTRAVVE